MSKGIKIQTAIKNGKTISIYDSEDRSYFDDCFCPDENCNSPLVAKKGNIRTHHFAHKSNSPSCYGLETALHLRTKEILQKIGYLDTPKYSLNLDILYYALQDEISKIEREYDFNIYKNILAKNKIEFYPLNEYFNKFNGRYEWVDFTVVESKRINLNNYTILSEKLEGSIVPDITLVDKQSTEKIYIEVGVTHLVDEHKRKKIEEKDFTVLEIDLSGYYKNFDTPEKHIEQYFLRNQFQEYITKRWINIQKIGNFINSKKNEIIEEFTKVLIEIKKIFEMDVLCEFKEEFRRNGEVIYIDRKEFLRRHRYELEHVEILELLNCPDIFDFFVKKAYELYSQKN
ncbi:competence protein CoiA family protein [Winogradskyella poriferorum]|uniref:Competence protein CoiA family protein n=1 Tax=Winogradskyella poriferorum TaxID=307627 RepID=A0ABU7W1J7_9FLAO